MIENKSQEPLMSKETFFKKREYEWLVISQSYFQCALMNARVLREELSNFAITVDSPLDFLKNRGPC